MMLSNDFSKLLVFRIVFVSTSEIGAVVTGHLEELNFCQ